jgi:predicted permease
MIRLLVALFPRHFRQTYGADMRDVFRDQLAAARRSGRRMAVPALWIHTTFRMTGAALREHRAAHRFFRGFAMMDFFRYDLRFTGRALARTPVFTAITVGVIAIGIGGVATIFSSLNALVLRPIPGTTEGHELFTIDRRTEDHSEGVSISGALYQHLRTSTRALDDVAVWSRVQLSMATGDRNLAVNGSIVSANYFEALGIRPAAGGFFTRDESIPAVVISHALWTRHFAGSTNVGGRAVTLNGRPYTIIGVAPEGFRGVFTPLRIDAWVPLSAQPHVRPGRDLAHAPWLWMFGRVRDGVAPEQARAELTTILGAWTTSDGADPYKRYTVFRFTPLTGLPDDARRALLGFGGLLLGAAVLVLIVAGANVSTLLAMRATARRQEMGLRTALGAGRAQLVRHLLTETLVLFLAGATGGLLLAWVGTSALEQLHLPGTAGLMLELSPDLRVVGVVTSIGLLAAVVFGLGPALRGATHNPALLIRSATAGSGTRRSVATSALIVGQLAASLVLLSTTTLFVRALAHGATIDPGFNRENVGLMSFNTEAFGYDDARSAAFYSTLHTRVKELGGVADLAYGQAGPLLAQTSNGAVTITRARGDERIGVEQTLAGDGYFSTLGISISEGRGFDARDRAGVAVVSEAFAKRAWPDRSQVTGLTFRRGACGACDHDRTVTVVGVAREVKFGDLDDPATPFVYLPLGEEQMNKILFVRTTPGAARVEAAIAGIVRDIDPAVPVPTMLRLSEEAGLALMPQRVAAMVTSALGGGALLLACAGLYGAIAFLVAARTREIGVRMALGATPREVVRLFLSDGLRLTGVGVAVGLAGSVGAAQLVSGLLLGGDTFDPAAFATAAVVLMVVATLAILIPARRAAAVDPSASLIG